MADLVSAPRLDNQATCYAGLEALLAAEPRGYRAGARAVRPRGGRLDVGSRRAVRSAATVLERIVLAAGGSREDFLRRLPDSLVASGDMAHATHPNYPERHEPGHLIEVNAGPVLKVQPQPALRHRRPHGRGVRAGLQRRPECPLQRYEHRADLPCGSTIGPLTSARTGIPTVDVGAAQLAMHSRARVDGRPRRGRVRGGAAGVSVARAELYDSAMTLNVEMVTFDCADPAKLGGWWAEQFDGRRRA